MTASLYQSASTAGSCVGFAMRLTVGATMGGAQLILGLETACPQAVRLLVLLLILIVLMILPDHMGAQVKIGSKIKSMSKRSSPPACSSRPVGGLDEQRCPLSRFAQRSGCKSTASAYFFGNAMACAATHCHSPLRSTQVSVKR